MKHYCIMRLKTYFIMAKWVSIVAQEIMFLPSFLHIRHFPQVINMYTQLLVAACRCQAD